MSTQARVLTSACWIRASLAEVWEQITEVDIAAIPHAWWLPVLGIPRPLRADVLEPGVGGQRVAHFEGGRRFTQEITEWRPSERFGFTFHASADFVVGHVLNLSTGPFRMKAGRYTLEQKGEGVELTLSSDYVLHGVVGVLLRLPVILTLWAFQRYLLGGIRANAERADA